MKKQLYKNIKGVRDINEKDFLLWKYVIDIIQKILNRSGFNQVLLQTLENKSLFERTLGDSCEIINKQLYQVDTDTVLRPEGTASSVRFVYQQTHNIDNCYKKFFYFGPMFRREKPQKARYREFYQLGAESILSSKNILAQEIEVITIINLIFKELNLDVILKINNIGTYKDRQSFIKDFSYFINIYKSILNNEQIQTFERNPLRLLDTKDIELKKILHQGPKLCDYIDNTHFKILLDCLYKSDINFKQDNCLVRGLDYYSGTVFEWDCLDLSVSLCAGGRYDDLVENKLSCFGFAFGIDRLVAALKSTKKAPNLFIDIDIYVCGDPFYLDLALFIKIFLGKIYLYTNWQEKSIKNHLEQAFLHKAKHLVYWQQETVDIYCPKTKNIIAKKLDIQGLITFFM